MTFGIRCGLFVFGVLVSQNIPCVFDDDVLEPAAGSEERDFPLARQSNG